MFHMSRGHFLIEIPACPEELLTIRGLHVVAEVTLLLKGFNSQTKSLRAGKNLRASMTTLVGKFRNFQHNLISSACFHARGRRSSRCRISTILVSSESLCYLFSKSTVLAQRRALVHEMQVRDQRPPKCTPCRGVIF